MTETKTAKHVSYLKLVAPVALVFLVVVSFFVGLPVLFNNSTPVRVVESGSMCVLYDGGCDGFLSVTHEFTATLHKGDLIVIQGVDPETINADYPNSDIIVYTRPDYPGLTPVVHRVVAKYVENGTLYFQTKGDGNETPYPQNVSVGEYDSNYLWHTGQGVPAQNVLGKVVMRVPYIGWITLIMKGNSWGLPLIIAIIAVLLVVEFVLPEVKKKTKKQTATAEEKSDVAMTPDGFII